MRQCCRDETHYTNNREVNLTSTLGKLYGRIVTGRVIQKTDFQRLTKRDLRRNEVCGNPWRSGWNLALYTITSKVANIGNSPKV